MYMDFTAEKFPFFTIYIGKKKGSIIYVRFLIKPTAEGRLFD